MTDPEDRAEPLTQWVNQVSDELGIDHGDVDVALLLDVARDAAHGVVRPAAPVTTYLLGLAQGRRGGGVEELRALASRLPALLAARDGASAEPAREHHPHSRPEQHHNKED